MAKEKSPSMGSFKVSEAVKRPVSPDGPSLTKRKGPSSKAEPAPSVGFPTIEKLIEADTLDRTGLKARAKELTDLSKNGNNKEKAGAKRALVAYERVEELLDYLWATKQQLSSPPAPSTPDPKAKKGARART